MEKILFNCNPNEALHNEPSEQSLIDFPPTTEFFYYVGRRSHEESPILPSAGACADLRTHDESFASA
uniref:Uncharacterized protein n=1 Tax=Kalanchoe fedtschenkoi TaxID=63787 RepID=A0A7N0TFH7_KALFE